MLNAFDQGTINKNICTNVIIIPFFNREDDCIITSLYIIVIIVFTPYRSRLLNKIIPPSALIIVITVFIELSHAVGLLIPYSRFHMLIIRAKSKPFIIIIIF